MMWQSSLVLLFVCVASALQPGPGVVSLFYKPAWSGKTFEHYNADGRGWTVPPGVQMNASTDSRWPAPEYQMLHVGANSMVFVFTDGAGRWDNNGGKNYQVSTPGIFTVINGVLTTIQVFPKGCANNCSAHGLCDTQTAICKCYPGYFRADCSGRCPAVGNITCSARGQCNDGASGDGKCVCNTGFANCGALDACQISTTNDTHNCGGCGIECDRSAGVKTSECKNSQCVVSCKPGYILCFGQCISGSSCQKPPLPGCEIFHENQCAGDVIVTDPSFENHRWFTPAKGDPGYEVGFQDYARVVAHTHVVYAANMSVATVTVIALARNASVVLKFGFDGAWQSGNSRSFDRNKKTPLLVTVSGSDGSMLELEPVDFAWNAPTIAARSGDYRDGQKGAIVEFFGWPHKDIEKECDFLAKAGYLGAKVYPAQEQVMADQPFQNILNPWYFMYQPVSYRLQGRMGSRDDLRKMINTCRGLGVRVYADAVINHMVGGGNDANPFHRNNQGSCVKWPNKNSSMLLYPGKGKSPFYTQSFAYTYGLHTDQAPSQEFPAVPFGPTDFHCERPLNSWTSPLVLNAGWLSGLTDLNTEKENVRERIADYLTDLIGIGFSGFRIDAAKHINPDDLVAIFSKLRRNLGGALPADFITWWEILLGGEADMLMCNSRSGYNYGGYVTQALQTAGFSAADINKIKIWNSGYPKEPDADCGSITKIRSVIQNDDADQQNPGSSSRDMGNEGCVLVKGCDVAVHRNFEIKLFNGPNGVRDNDNDHPIRVVMSSYFFPANGARGIPDGLSDCSKCTIDCSSCQTVAYAPAFVATSTGYDMKDYTRVHRDAQIVAAMRRWIHL